MEAKITKTMLENLLVTGRAELDAALAAAPVERMTLPGAVGLWSVKDIVAHLAFSERWVTARMNEARRGEVYTLTELDKMDENQRNFVEYQVYKDMPLEKVQAVSRQAFEDLLAALREQDEAALFAPRQFNGAKEPVTLHRLLLDRVIEHYGVHLPSVRRMA